MLARYYQTPVVKVEITINVDEKTFEGLKKLADRLKVDVNQLIESSLASMSDYSGELARWGLELRVKKENRVQSLFDEVYFYAVEAWRGLVSKILDRLKAKGRFELEMLEFNPAEPSIIVELVALEGSDLLADRLRIDWSMDGVLLEAYYYLEEGQEPPLARQGEDYDWAYLPDEHAVVVTVRADSLLKIPPVHVIDKLSGLLD